MSSTTAVSALHLAVDGGNRRQVVLQHRGRLSRFACPFVVDAAEVRVREQAARGSTLNRRASFPGLFGNLRKDVLVGSLVDRCVGHEDDAVLEREQVDTGGVVDVVGGADHLQWRSERRRIVMGQAGQERVSVALLDHHAAEVVGIVFDEFAGFAPRDPLARAGS